MKGIDNMEKNINTIFNEAIELKNIIYSKYYEQLIWFFIKAKHLYKLDTDDNSYLNDFQYYYKYWHKLVIKDNSIPLNIDIYADNYNAVADEEVFSFNRIYTKGLIMGTNLNNIRLRIDGQYFENNNGTEYNGTIMEYPFEINSDLDIQNWLLANILIYCYNIRYENISFDIDNNKCIIEDVEYEIEYF